MIGPGEFFGPLPFPKSRPVRVLDVFCGAGGGTDATVEALRMLGYQVELTLVNHWDVACATAQANFPAARVLCTGVENIIAQHLYLKGSLDILQGGPECIEFSRAAGKKPKNYQYRPTPWCMLRFAEALQPRIVLIENVEEFEKKWPCFPAFVAAFRALGYRVEWKVFNAANYGDPTTRRRLFMMCVREPLRVVWPDATHSEQGGDGRAPWKNAEEHVIDWSRKGAWLDEMKGQARYGGLPLSPKTLDRVYDGLRKGGLTPLIVPFDNTSNKGGARTVKQPVSAVTSKARHAIAEPYFVELRGTGKSRSLKRPAPAVTAGGRHLAVIEPLIVPSDNRGGDAARSVKKPISAVTGRGYRHAVAEPFILPQNTRGEPTRSVKRPLHTVLGSSRSEVIVEPFIVPKEGVHGGNAVRSVKKPMATVTGDGRAHLVVSALLPQHGGGAMRSTRKPVPPVATAGHICHVEAFLVKYYGTAKSVSLKKPLPAVTTRDRFALCCPVVVVDGKVRRVRIRWRILEPHELAAAQGFRRDYRFFGGIRKRGKMVAIEENANKGDVVKQIGNAWPHHLARALMLAAITQQRDIRPLLRAWERRGA